MKIIYYIKKRFKDYIRLYFLICQNLNVPIIDFFFHIEVHWLPKGNMLIWV